jgi:hypothetical protein
LKTQRTGEKNGNYGNEGGEGEKTEFVKRRCERKYQIREGPIGL